MLALQVTAAMKNGHMGYKAVYKGPATGNHRITWESLALSFIIVGCDIVRLHQQLAGGCIR